MLTNHLVPCTRFTIRVRSAGTAIKMQMSHSSGGIKPICLLLCWHMDTILVMSLLEWFCYAILLLHIALQLSAKNLSCSLSILFMSDEEVMFRRMWNLEKHHGLIIFHFRSLIRAHWKGQCCVKFSFNHLKISLCDFVNHLLC